MSELLTDRTPRVAAARKLLRRAAREDAGRFLVEGLRPARDAITWAEEGVAAADRDRVHDLFATEALADREADLLDRAEDAGVRVSLVTEKALAGLTDTVTPQGVAVVARLLTTGVSDAVRGARLVAVLVGVSDPGNAGAVLRTADAAGADAVVLAGDSVDPHNPKCVRATMGSLFHLPLARERDPAAVLAALSEAGLVTVAADGYGETELGRDTDTLLAGPTAWLFGGEAHGLDPDLADAADHRVRVPRYGRAESLNLAAAAAVCLYASARAHHVAGGDRR